MKIKVLGSSSGWALPRLGCSCKICSSINEKDKRMRSAIIINDSILVDAGPDIYHQLIRFNISKITAILLTHSHPDHILGLHDLIPKKFRAMRGVPVYGLEETWIALKKIFPNAGYKKEFFESYKSFDLGGLKFTPVPVVHSKNASTVGFVIKEQKVLGYFPDFRSLVREDDKKFFEELDCLFLDGSTLKHPLPVGTSRWGHISIMDGMRFATSCKVKKTVFTHIGHRTLPHDDLCEFIRNKGEFHVAFDGMEIIL
jgi:phosphoribosyl 1,2-cyclic phosphate phosphodiesterase